MDLAGRQLAIAESGVVRDGPLTYHRTRVSTVALRVDRLGAARAARRMVVIRTSIGPFGRALLDLERNGSFVVATAGRSFAGPVVWCCDSGEERVVYSDGRPGAARPIAVAGSGGLARAMLRRGDGALTLIERTPAGAIAAVPVTARGPLPIALDGRDVAGGLAAGPLGIARRAISAHGPVVDPPRAEVRPRAGRLIALRLDGGAAVLLARRGTRWEVRRQASDGRQRVLWRGSGRPRALAAGGGRTAVVTGRRIWTGRGARRLRVTHRAAGGVAALTVDGNRLAWMERVGPRVRVRLARLR